MSIERDLAALHLRMEELEWQRDSYLRREWDAERAKRQAEKRAEALTAALRKVLKYADRMTCEHEETHRGGAIWTICDGCGQQWADDRGGFQPHVDPPEFAEARELLTGDAA